MLTSSRLRSAAHRSRSLLIRAQIPATKPHVLLGTASSSFSTKSTSAAFASSSNPSNPSMPVSSEPKTSSSKCPFSQARDLSSGAASFGEAVNPNQSIASSGRVELKEVPSWPVVGSFFSIIPGIGTYVQDYYNIPAIAKGNAYEFYSTMNKRFGDFYRIIIPGFGQVHTLNEPSEMIKVLRQEGSYPRGGVTSLTPFIRWAKERDLNLVKGNGTPNDTNGFFGQGETWRTARTFMQSDLLSPQSAKGYVPAIVEAAKIASKGAPHYSDNLNTFLNYCAFDMFQTVMFGELTKVSDPNTPTEPVNEEFVENSIQSLALMIHQIVDKNEVIKAKMGITTPSYKKFEVAMDTVNRIANDKIMAFMEKWKQGDLNESEKASYVAHTFERQKNGESLSPEQMTEIVMFALNAGVDTTSTFICWAMVHLSLNPDIQDKLYEELKQNLNENGGILSAEMLTKKKSPYLHAVLRESHRCTPVHPTVMMKSNSTDEIEIHGRTFPKGSLFSFDSYSVGVDPSIVENPDQFIPDRWSPEATESRKGTRAEILDHQFYKDPFSQGARRCPGSRVAVNETLVLLSQIVLDWKFKPVDPNLSSFKEVEYEQKTLLVPILPEMSFSARL